MDNKNGSSSNKPIVTHMTSKVKFIHLPLKVSRQYDHPVVYIGNVFVEIGKLYISVRTIRALEAHTLWNPR